MAFPPIDDTNDVLSAPDLGIINDPDRDPFQHDQRPVDEPLDRRTVPVPPPEDLPPPVFF